MEDIDTVNTDIRLTISSIEKFKHDADKLCQEAETKTTLGKFVTLVQNPQQQTAHVLKLGSERQEWPI